MKQIFLVILAACLLAIILASPTGKHHKMDENAFGINNRHCQRALKVYSFAICGAICQNYEKILMEGCGSTVMLTMQRTKLICCPEPVDSDELFN
ncbi:INSulin related [Caenorhabditis elegans]|uniref:INSulin related n=1 Tax=Caenorhabditis elegans TaxID=6239 RepID=Q9XUV3_CAEEL|nr:INSulin related [Caenorhabditis elegans]CAB04546.1 INSulin related [Caenorhabditis elegans]|eukprot:NP_507926.1 INSulin related [Caenorhabditis elegans]